MTPNCDQLAKFLDDHKASLMDKWLVHAREDSEVLSARLSRNELTDHVPKIFDTVIASLRNQCGQTKSAVQDITARHTVIRWVQQYDLRSVLREVTLLRVEFIYLLIAFVVEYPETDDETKLLHAVTVHQILDDIVLDAAETYVMLRDRAIEDR